MKDESGFTLLAALTLFGIGGSIYGLYLAFSANIILGAIVLIVEPLPLVIAVVAWLGHPELSRVIATWLKLPL